MSGTTHHDYLVRRLYMRGLIESVPVVVGQPRAHAMATRTRQIVTIEFRSDGIEILGKGRFYGADCEMPTL